MEQTPFLEPKDRPAAPRRLSGCFVDPMDLEDTDYCHWSKDIASINDLDNYVSNGNTYMSSVKVYVICNHLIREKYAKRRLPTITHLIPALRRAGIILGEKAFSGGNNPLGKLDRGTPRFSDSANL